MKRDKEYNITRLDPYIKRKENLLLVYKQSSSQPVRNIHTSERKGSEDVTLWTRHTYVRISFQVLCKKWKCGLFIDQRKNFERNYALQKISFIFRNSSLNYDRFFYNKCFSFSYKNVVSCVTIPFHVK